MGKIRQMKVDQKCKFIQWMAENKEFAAYGSSLVVAQKAEEQLGFEISPSSVNSYRRAMWPQERKTVRCHTRMSDTFCLLKNWMEANKEKILNISAERIARLASDETGRCFSSYYVYKLRKIFTQENKGLLERQYVKMEEFLELKKTVFDLKEKLLPIL